MVESVRSKMLTHIGSIELQAQLEEDPIVLPSIIFQEIEDNLTLICLDTYGNYVCQKVIPYLSFNQVYRFICCIFKEFDLMATSIPGSCIISVLMNFSANGYSCKKALLENIENHVAQLICDPQGSHLLQLALKLYEEGDIGFILRTVRENFFIISTDRFGCCLIKKIIEIENASDQDCETISIFSQVCTNLITLSNVNNTSNTKRPLIDDFRTNLVITLYNITLN